MILPKTDISIMDVRNVLGYPSTDLGTLCSCPNINMWAKYKPVQDSFTTNRPSDWWKGRNNDCGISIKIYGDFDSMFNSIANGETQYTYLYPTGGAGNPYRLGDFAGYNHDSVPPIFESNIEGTYYGTQDNLIITPFIRTDSSVDDLSLNDLYGGRFVNYYFGAAFRRKNESAIYWMTSSNSGSVSVTVPIRANNSTIFRAGTLDVVQFITQRQKPSFLSSITGSGGFVGIPEGRVQTITIKSSSYVITITGIYNYSNKTISGTITVRNDSAAINFNNVAIHYKYSNSTETSTIVAIQQLNNFTASANTTTTVQYTSRTNVLPNFNTLGGKLYLYANNQLQCQTVVLMQS